MSAGRSDPSAPGEGGAEDVPREPELRRDPEGECRDALDGVEEGSSILKFPDELIATLPPDSIFEHALPQVPQVQLQLALRRPLNSLRSIICIANRAIAITTLLSTLFPSLWTIVCMLKETLRKSAGWRGNF
jgi:hypothetical protein